MDTDKKMMLTDRASYQALQAHYEEVRKVHLRDLFVQDEVIDPFLDDIRSVLPVPYKGYALSSLL